MNYNDYNPNLRKVKIKKETVSQGKTRPYLCIYEDNLQAAMKDLTNAEFKVYLMLMCNANGYEYGFSPAYIKNITGIHEDTIRKAFKTLYLKGYIKELDMRKNMYEFNEIPIIEKTPTHFSWE